MELDDIKKEKILNGEIAILEKKEGDKVTIEELNEEEFRDFIGCQENIEVMCDCVTLLYGNQVNYSDGLYRLVYGQKLVIDTFEIFAGYFIDAVNDSIEEIF